MVKMTALQRKAEIAMKEAVRGVIEQHKKSGRPLVIWKNGKVVHLSPRSIK